MTFDDGKLEIYRTVNAADPGEKPRMELRYQSSHAFGYETVGISRYYTALQAKEKIEEVVHIWEGPHDPYGRCLPDRRAHPSGAPWSSMSWMRTGSRSRGCPWKGWEKDDRTGSGQGKRGTSGGHGRGIPL